MTDSASVQQRPATPLVQRLVSVLWPSFLVAGAATVLFFTAFDPVELVDCEVDFGTCRMMTYSIGFFLFWALTALSSFLTCYFRQPCPPPEQR